MRKRMNVAIRQFMINQIGIFGPMASEVLVVNTKRAFPTASSKRVAGNLSSLCCYYRSLSYNSGIVS